MGCRNKGLHAVQSNSARAAEDQSPECGWNSCTDSEKKSPVRGVESCKICLGLRELD